MKLSEILENLVSAKKLTIEERNQISSSVDEIKSKAVETKNQEIEDLRSKNELFGKENLEFKTKARNKTISKIVKEFAKEEAVSDVLLLSGIKDEDDEKIIKDKISKTLETREYLKKESKIPVELTKNEKVKEEEKKVKDNRLENL